MAGPTVQVDFTRRVLVCNNVEVSFDAQPDALEAQGEALVAIARHMRQSPPPTLASAEADLRELLSGSARGREALEALIQARRYGNSGLFR